MKLKEQIEQFQEGRFASFVRKALNSIWFPIVTAVYFIIFYYLKLDLMLIWYISLCGVAILVTCKDITPFFVILMFINILVSKQNSPSISGGIKPSNYYFQKSVLIPIVIAGVLLISLVITRIILAVKNGKVKLNGTLICLLIFCASVFIGGAFSSKYTPKNLMFSACFTVALLAIFVLINGNIEICDKTFIKISYYFTIFMTVLGVELLVGYATFDGLIDNGMIIRDYLTFGWGVYNNMAMLLMLCLPAWFYLASKIKQGWICTLGGIVNLGLIYLTMSRQAMLGAVLIAVCCFVWLIKYRNGKERYINLGILAVIAVIGVVIVLVVHKQIAKFIEIFPTFFDVSNNSRLRLWNVGITEFKKFPLFGPGFYAETELGSPSIGGLSFFPVMYHNTFVQLAVGCGLVGIIAYLVHRVQTVVSLFKNFTNERIYIALSMLTILVVSLFDNHIFYILPTMSYASLLALLAKTEKGDNEASTAVNLSNNIGG